MRKCPVCSTVDLVQVDYEGFIVQQCSSCGGHLVPLQRFECIKRVDMKSQQELKEEASSQFKGSSTQPLKCPKCRMTMRKQAVKLPVLNLQTDFCRTCDLIWLDGGELALLQLVYQASAKFINAQDLKRRINELETSPERKAQFERNFAELPDSRDPVEAALGEAGEEILTAILRSGPVRPW